MACIPPEVASAFGIEVVPIWVRLGGDLLRDGVDVSPQEVYRRLRQGEVLGHDFGTSAPSPGDFLAAYERLARRGATGIVTITLPAELSAVYESARLAAEESPVPTWVVDSRTAAAAQGWVVVEAARAAAAGAPVEQVLARIEHVRRRTGLVAMVPELKYLRRGGRVVQVLARIGAALGVVPLLGIIHEGHIEPVAIAPSREAAAERIMAQLRAEARRGPLHVAVIEADAAEAAAELAQRIQTELEPLELWTTAFSPAMGLHAGPGIVGVGYWVERP